MQFASFLPELHLHSHPLQSESQSERATGSSKNSSISFILVKLVKLVSNQPWRRAPLAALTTAASSSYSCSTLSPITLSHGSQSPNWRGPPITSARVDLFQNQETIPQRHHICLPAWAAVEATVTLIQQMQSMSLSNSTSATFVFLNKEHYSQSLNPPDFCIFICTSHFGHSFNEFWSQEAKNHFVRCLRRLCLISGQPVKPLRFLLVWSTPFAFEFWLTLALIFLFSPSRGTLLTREQLFDWGRKKSLSGFNLTSCHFLELTSFQSETSEDIEGVSIGGIVILE